MKKEVIRTANAPMPGGPYSQGIISGKRIYVSGQRPVDTRSGEIPSDFEAQARLCLGNIRSVLEAGNAGMNDVVMVTVYLSDIANFAAFNEIYKQYFAEPFPARTTVSCTLRGIMVEISAIAEI